MKRIAFGLVCLAFVGCLQQKSTGTAPAAKTAQLPTREEFQTKVVGKTKDEIIALIGRPARTWKLGDSDRWVYYEVNRDGISGKTDFGATIAFAGDVATAVTH